MEFVWIEPMGIWVGKYEVTNGEYRCKQPEHHSGDYKGHSLNGERQPVVQVNFNDAKSFAAWMTERDRAAEGLPKGFRYRLPSEQEWETFAKAGRDVVYPWGNTWPPVNGQAGNYADQALKKLYPIMGFLTSIRGYNDGHAVSAPVEQSWKNPWELFGVGGNVWEMAAKDASNESFGAWRGGSWHDDLQDVLRVTYRGVHVGSNHYYVSGFRLVLSR